MSVKQRNTYFLVTMFSTTQVVTQFAVYSPRETGPEPCSGRSRTYVTLLVTFEMQLFRRLIIANHSPALIASFYSHSSAQRNIVRIISDILLNENHNENDDSMPH